MMKCEGCTHYGEMACAPCPHCDDTIIDCAATNVLFHTESSVEDCTAFEEWPGEE